MRPATVIMLGIAFVCAGLAAFLMRGALRGSNEPQSVAPAAVEATRVVVVAARDIRAGDKLTADVLREATWPATMAPKGAFASKDAILKQGEERQAAVALAENEPVLASKLMGSSETALAGRLSEGMSGVTIRVNETSSVGGFAQPDDRVDVLLTGTDRVGEAIATSKAYTVTLIRNVRVLAVDQQTSRKTQAQPPKTVTLEVTTEDSKKLTLAGTIGQLSLTLNRGGSSAGNDGGVIDIGDLLQRPPAQQAAETTPISINPVVAITRSVERKEYSVPQEGRR